MPDFPLVAEEGGVVIGIEAEGLRAELLGVVAVAGRGADPASIGVAMAGGERVRGEVVEVGVVIAAVAVVNAVDPSRTWLKS
jgi:hypothetical protein